MTLTGKELLIAKRIDKAEVFSKRFGTFSKADFEILMFTIYLDMLDSPAKDYNISIDLGITESKVRQLRIKSQLLYPRNLDWQDELHRAMEKGFYDQTNHTITIMIEDPSVQSLIKSKIESAYGVVQPTLNIKHLCMPVEGYILLASMMEEDQELALRKLNEKVTATNIEIAKITRVNLAKRIWNKTADASNILTVVTAAITIWEKAKPLLNSLANLISF